MKYNYSKLISLLRDDRWDALKPSSRKVIREAADAIEELSKPRWIPITSRPMTEDERRERGTRFFAIKDDEGVIYTCPLPDDGQKVLVSYTHNPEVGIDAFVDDFDYGCSFVDNGEMGGISAWMPLPEPYKEET